VINLPPRHLPQPAHLLAVEGENNRTKTFIFDAHWQAQPGQFLMAWLPRFDEKPFSLVNDDPVTITVAAVGPFTTLLHRLRPGDRVWLRGPLGRGFQTETSDRPLLVGGGYGVAPLSFLARRSIWAGAQVLAVIGARTAGDLIFAERLRRLGAEVRLSTEDGSLGARGLATDVVEPLLAAGACDSLFACGPHGMLAALAGLAARFRIPAQLSWEAYMRCGLGLCGSCEKDGKILCLEGPVLPLLPAGDCFGPSASQ
jgi:dihydroorotate dehydrogenase electron transfer subunit